MANRNRVPANEVRVALQHGTFDDRSADGIDAVQHEELLVLLCRRLHRQAESRDVCVEARADVLNVEHERVEILQLLGQWRTPPTDVKAVDRETCDSVPIIGDIRSIFQPANPMLRTEQRYETHAR